MGNTLCFFSMEWGTLLFDSSPRNGLPLGGLGLPGLLGVLAHLRRLEGLPGVLAHLLRLGDLPGVLAPLGRRRGFLGVPDVSMGLLGDQLGAHLGVRKTPLLCLHRWLHRPHQALDPHPLLEVHFLSHDDRDLFYRRHYWNHYHHHRGPDCRMAPP